MPTASALFIDAWLDDVRSGACRRQNRQAFQQLRESGMEDEVVAKVEEIRSSVRTRQDVVDWSARFRWTSDPNKGASDWSPDIFKIAWDLVRFGQVRDDCDGAARFTDYLFKYLSENTGTWHRVHEYTVIPRPVIKGVAKAHVVLAEYRRSDGDLDDVVVWSNGHVVPGISRLADYAAKYARDAGFDGTELRMLPPSNMDRYLADRFFGPKGP